MPLRKEDIIQLADELYAGLYTASVTESITDRFPEVTIDDAYAVQLANVQKELDKGKKVTGKKIGLTSKAMQNLLNVNQPDYGHLFDDMAVANHGVIASDELVAPKVEAEIAFVLKKDLIGGNLTVDDILDAADYVIASLEIVDSRVRDWKIKIGDTIADNGSSSRYVLSERRINPKEIDLKAVTMAFYKNGEFVNAGKGEDALGDPSFCVAWLGNCLHQYDIDLHAGEVILSGALSAAVPAKKGDAFEARFSTLGNVSVTFI